MKSVAITLRSWFSNSKVGTRSKWLTPGRMDVFLFLLVLSMVLFGLVMVFSASFIFAQERTGNGFSFIGKQLEFAFLGFFALWLAFKLDYRIWGKFAYPLLFLATLVLGLILIPGIGVRVGGARRWIHLAGWSVQPGEFAKFAVIFFVARQLDQKRDRLRTFTAGILSPFLLSLPVLLFLLLQPDFGTAVMISGVIFSLVFLAGVPIRFLLVSLFSALVIGGWLAFGSAYRYARLITFLDPWKDPGGRGFQIIQSFVGLHNGRLWGVGLGNGKEKLFYLPEAHNDFIFSVIGEELGFIGISLVVLGYLLFIYRGLKISWDCYRKAGDCFGTYLAAGITLALGFQGFVNMAVVMGLLPTKGLTLPFISYGGSALVVDLFAVGILLSIAKSPHRAPSIPIKSKEGSYAAAPSI